MEQAALLQLHYLANIDAAKLIAATIQSTAFGYHQGITLSILKILDDGQLH
jgi:hypothetical protein